MSTRKRVLRTTIVVLSLLGTTALVATIALSLKPTPKPVKYSEAKISSLAIGNIVSVDADNLKFFLLRLGVDEFQALAVPTDNGEVLMPDEHWFKPVQSCKHFEFVSDDNTAREQRYFRCLDAVQDNKWRERWKWDQTGRAVANQHGDKVDDMYPVIIERKGDTVRFVRLGTH